MWNLSLIHILQERKIGLAIFVVIGLLVGGIILDALSRFTVVNSAIATLVTVSYTHLDVYKRQP